jgi:enoyl-CoA hydratase/carnithine racemase
MTYETLEIRREESILWLTLNRPHNLNALSAKMVEELEDFLSGLRDDRETRVVILRGAGRAFCAGLDLKEQNRGGPEALGRSTTAVYESQRRMSDLTVAIRRAPQPFIAAIKGPAAGGGFALALACDCRIAGESTRMNAAFIRIGLTACDMGVSTLHRRQARARHWPRIRAGARFRGRRRRGQARARYDRDVPTRIAHDQGMPLGEHRCAFTRGRGRDRGSQPGAMRSGRLH